MSRAAVNFKVMKQGSSRPSTNLVQANKTEVIWDQKDAFWSVEVALAAPANSNVVQRCYTCIKLENEWPDI